MGMLWDRPLFEAAETHADPSSVAPDLLAQSVANKAEVVAQDEREQGIRALLNLGHTFAHAIESATSYQTYLHGEAVAIGLVAATRLSERMGLLDTELTDRVIAAAESLRPTDGLRRPGGRKAARSDGGGQEGIGGTATLHPAGKTGAWSHPRGCLARRSLANFARLRRTLKPVSTTWHIAKPSLAVQSAPRSQGFVACC